MKILPVMALHAELLQYGRVHDKVTWLPCSRRGKTIAFPIGLNQNSLHLEHSKNEDHCEVKNGDFWKLAPHRYSAPRLASAYSQRKCRTAHVLPADKILRQRARCARGFA